MEIAFPINKLLKAGLTPDEFSICMLLNEDKLGLLKELVKLKGRTFYDNIKRLNFLGYIKYNTIGDIVEIKDITLTEEFKKGNDMEIKLNKIPKNLNKPIGLCYYGKLSRYDKNKFIKNRFIIKEFDKYTDIYFTKKSNIDIFSNNISFKYIDGFSPNLNKELHIGHFSNLIIAKAFQKLNIAKNTISLFGDTLKEGLDNKIGYKLIKKLINKFDYKINKQFFASKLSYGGVLEEGQNKYKGTKIININGNKIVLIKKDGSTSYTYHDLALSYKLNANTLYLTGYEQENHFNNIKQLFPNIKHIPLGLVKISNVKMSSRDKDSVLLIKDIIKQFNLTFNSNKLSYNVFAGYILKAKPISDKNIDFKSINNHKNSLGLYISYTMARFYRAGCINIPFVRKDKELEYACIQSRNNLNPSILFNELVDYCKELNNCYQNIKIKGNLKNRIKLSIKLSNLIFYTNKLGMYFIKKV